MYSKCRKVWKFRIQPFGHSNSVLYHCWQFCRRLLALFSVNKILESWGKWWYLNFFHIVLKGTGTVWKMFSENVWEPWNGTTKRFLINLLWIVMKQFYAKKCNNYIRFQSCVWCYSCLISAPVDHVTEQCVRRWSVAVPALFHSMNTRAQWKSTSLPVIVVLASDRNSLKKWKKWNQKQWVQWKLVQQ